MKTKCFRIRFEELPALGEFVGSSFGRDKELFESFSPLYANGFEEKYYSKLKAVKEAHLPQVITMKRMMVTQNLHAAQEKMLVIANGIKRYCQIVGGS
jgi:hypothetical protein